MAILLQNMAVSQDPNHFSNEKHDQLLKWLEGLFATDENGETGGISDDVMGKCPPQAFYQLVTYAIRSNHTRTEDGTFASKDLHWRTRTTRGTIPAPILGGRA